MGKQGLHCRGENTCLKPMWPQFKSRLHLVVRGPLVYLHLELYVSSFTSQNIEFGLVLCFESICLVDACESGEECSIR